MTKLLSGLVVLSALVCGGASGYELQRYENPVPMGGYVKDVPELLKKTTQRAKWKLLGSQNGEYLASLLYKKYLLEAEFVVVDDAITVKLKSVECEGCKVKQSTVDKLMIRLRRTLAYEVTVEARDSFRNF
ncbi:hypothetical protein L2750_02455 [Shewanella submarina]|uniref:Uncharacterized protein n=1 Tax=Shewanella submarina TaxID=2016376 RepID=A0ABV7GFP4_9GAMM|nr:hypothetical protein [Shewanella submarina]MCL1036015.1 hypothetical protein [Shewanella submarina]